MDGEDHLMNQSGGSGNLPPLSNGMNGQQQNQAGQGQLPFPPPIQQPPLLRPPQFQPQNQQQHPQVTTDVLMLQVLQQIAQQLQQQQAMYQQQNQSFLRQQGQIFQNGINVQVPPNPELLLDSLASNIKEFRFEPDQNVTFVGWFARYKDLFEKDAIRLDDSAKTRLLLRKVGPSEYERYCNYILPQSPNDINFDSTVAKLKSLFGTTESEISRRYRCLQVTKQATEDYKSYACRVNKLCVEFELGRLSEDQFKCLVFVLGLKAEKDSEIRTRLLSRIEENADVNLEQISDECQRILTIKHDTAMIESASSPSSAAVQAVKQSQQFENQSFRPNKEAAPRSTRSNGKTPGSPCWNCGSMHYSWDCPFAQHRCRDCGQVGHKDGYCLSARKASKPVQRPSGFVETRSIVVQNVEMRRKFVQAQVNGRLVALQLDTASDISIISEHTWREIGKPAPEPTTVKAATASGKPLKLEFQCVARININGVVREGRFFVVKQQLNLLGLDLIDEFNFWSVPINQFCNQVRRFRSTLGAVRAGFPVGFNVSPGLCTKAKAKFNLKEGQRPVACKTTKQISEGRGREKINKTPNPSASESKSPSETMFGRKIWTSLDLLQPPAVPVVEANAEQNTNRSFQEGNCVYVKIYSVNAWRWAPGVVLERLGRVMFNIWVEDIRTVRSHLNQLRFRATADQRGSRVQGANSSSKLHLDVLLKECNVQRSSGTPNNTAAPALSQQSANYTTSLRVLSEQSTSIRTLQPKAEQKVWESLRSPSLRSAPASPAVPSTSKPDPVRSPSPEFLSASETKPAVPFKPRHSSRTPRASIRFDPYQLF